MPKISIKDAEKIVKNADQVLFKGRVKRTKFLESLYDHDKDFAPVDTIADNYLTEACRCWLNGVFVSTIIMMQAALETQLRQHFNFFLLFHNDQNLRKKTNDMNFYQLIELAKKTKLISKSETERLHNLRRLRNPFVHTYNDDKGSTDPSGNSATSIQAKISEFSAAELGYKKGSTLEKDAKNAIGLLPLFWKIVQRFDIRSFVKQFADERRYNVYFYPNKKRIMKKFKTNYKTF